MTLPNQPNLSFFTVAIEKNDDVVPAIISATKSTKAGSKRKADDLDDSDDDDSHQTWCVNTEDMRTWAPHRLEGTWENDDGVRFVTIVVALTGGTTATDDEGVDVELINGGTEIQIAEKWCREMTHIDEFYKSFKKQEDETIDEFTQRRFAMKRACRLHTTFGPGNVPGPAQATCTHALPFLVDPASVKVTFYGSESGCRLCHIDMSERRKISKRTVTMIGQSVLNNLVPTETNKFMRCSNTHTRG